MKKCFECHRQLPRAEFYDHHRMADGKLGKCKVCVKKGVAARYKEKQNDPVWLEKERARCRLKSKLAKLNGQTMKPSIEPGRKWRKRNKVKVRVWNTVQKALVNGKIKSKKTCQDCGSAGKLHKHHEDYSKPLSVEWLCPACHGKRHRKAFGEPIKPRLIP
jgi:hypothetical protein